MCKYLVIIFVIVITTTAQTDSIFELASEYYVGDGSLTAVVYMDGGYFNDDAYPDIAEIYFAAGSSSLYTLLGNGDCTFDVLTTDLFDYTLGSITVNDFDNDGYDDLLIGEGYAVYNLPQTPFEEDLIHLFKGNGDGTFTELNTLSEKNIWVTSGDLNNDGHYDFIAASQGTSMTGDTISVFLGNGNFKFQATESYEIPGSTLHTVQVLGDMDMDGNVDIGVLCLNGWIQFLYGNGDGTFQAPVSVVNYFPCGPSYCFLESGDFNEDGMPDFVATCGGYVAGYDIVYLWDGSEYIPSDSMTSGGEWVDVRDYDLDMHLDIALSICSAPSYLFPGNGDGTLSTPFKITLDDAVALYSSDFDLDGDFDLVFNESPYSQPSHLRCYRNTTINLGVEEHESGPNSDLILAVSPNPFATSVIVSASGFSSNPSDLQIFDLSGRLVTEIAPAFNGSEAVYHWNGRSETGSELPDGIYSARLSFDNSSAGITLLKLE